MSAEPFVFWPVAVLLVGSALAVVLSKNLFHSVLWLALALTGTAVVFLSLNAEFIAAVQLLLYAGGVITIVVFAIVVTERLVGERLSHTSARLWRGGLVAVVFAAAVLGVLGRMVLPETAPAMAGDLTRMLGERVLTEFALAFELLAVLLVTALIGAIYFARPED
jgi:NADH-quinone oxidoreductase subunit J